MRQLLLYRHAKSAWDDPGLTDRDRTLSARGRQDAALAAAGIAEYPIDLILCSPARRTLETLAALVPLLRGEPQIAITESLYEAVTGEYRQVIAGLGKDAGCLLVIGHNPAIHETALALVGDGDDAELHKLAAKYPTGALAAISFDSDNWADIAPHSGRLTAFRRPRDLDEQV